MRDEHGKLVGFLCHVTVVAKADASMFGSMLARGRVETVDMSGRILLIPRTGAEIAFCEWALMPAIRLRANNRKDLLRVARNQDFRRSIL